MHGQITVCALPDIPVSLGIHAHHMGILEICTEDNERNADGCHLKEETLFPFIPSLSFPPVARKKACAAYRQKRQGSKKMRFHAERKSEGPQSRKPHQQEHAQGESQPDSVEKRMARKKTADKKHARRKKQQKIENTDHDTASSVIEFRRSFREECMTFSLHLSCVR